MSKLKMVIPKGRIYSNVVNLLNDSGFGVERAERVYVPRVEDSEIEAKIMKPQNIPKLVELGAHDIGFTGRDWVMETNANVTEILDLGFDRVKIVAAIPESLVGIDIKKKRMIVASEYERISKQFLKKEKYDFIFMRTYGATEVFPPEDADMIIDNTSTGRTLKEHNLHIICTVTESTTRLIANKTALDDPWKKEKIEEMKMLFQAVLDARERVMLEMNVPKERFKEIVQELPCMRSPTVSELHGEQGYAVKIAVKKTEVVKLIPMLKKYGATDILEYEMRKVVL
ncbi:ATP phosphoribosyltransferase [candidate division KSB1 bacterium]|nr:ATP phosphoribosyltransferase [candidate division KSB1 bacterium]MBL7095057.1 ATP phosphoribosyltransferase [candidate division KSB1 bacterium]